MHADKTHKTHIYYWPRNFVMRSSHFVQAYRDKPYQRLSATIVANPSAPVTLQAGQDEIISSRLALLSPGSRRQHIGFEGGDGFLFDIDISSQAFARLKPLLPFDGCRDISAQQHPLFETLSAWEGRELSPEDAVHLFHQVIDILCPGEARPIARDSRIEKILALIDENARDEITVSGLAKAVDLSESRLRSLVQSQLGCNLARYLRWATAWKTADLWRPGISYTEVAHAAGFHDLSHANRTFSELFGMPPTRVLKSENIQLHRCPVDQ